MEWSVSGNKYYHGFRQSVSKLPNAVYRVDQDKQSGALFLARVQDAFPLPSKIYGMDKQLIEQVVTAFNSGILLKNVGILLSGVKGTGKTVTAKQLCNQLNLPVIVVDTAHAALSRLLNDIQQEVLVFVDEYEKTYARDESALLSVMDGAMDNGFRRVFVLTTNGLFVSSNLLERPGRIRYVKNYVDLDLNTINDVVDDLLKHKNLRAETVEFISRLSTITIDIVKAVIDEVNIFAQPPETFKHIFNVKVMEDYFDVYDVSLDKDGAKQKPVLVAKGRQSQGYNASHKGCQVGVGSVRGYVHKIINKHRIVVVHHDGTTKTVLQYVPAKPVHASFVVKTPKTNKKQKTKIEDYDSTSVSPLASSCESVGEEPGEWEDDYQCQPLE